MAVVIVRDTELGYDPREYSATAALEKPARAALKVHNLSFCRVKYPPLVSDSYVFISNKSHIIFLFL